MPAAPITISTDDDATAGDAELEDAMHMHGDAGDAGSGPRQVRINGQCFAICQTDSDPDQNGVRDGWGWENQASCVMPDNPLASSSPGATHRCLGRLFR